MPGFSENNFCFHECDRTSGQKHAARIYFASDVTATPGNLSGAQDVFAELVGPVRRKRAVGGACYGIFRDAVLGGEEAADKIDIRSARRDYDAAQIKLAQQGVMTRTVASLSNTAM